MQRYDSVHRKLRQVRGNAKSHPCRFCGKKADEWALKKEAVTTTVSPDGLVFSSNLDDYMPLCFKCHKIYDRRGLTCNRGHPYSEGNLYVAKDGRWRCKACKRTSNDYYRRS